MAWPKATARARHSARTRHPAPPAWVAAQQGRRITRPPAWVRAVDAHPDTASLRNDSRETLRRIVWALAAAARPDSTTAPTWETLAAQTGRSRATVARWLAWLRTRGLLTVIETGSTTATRGGPAALATSGNLAAIYALTQQGPAPTAKETAELPASADGPNTHTPPRIGCPVEEHETPACGSRREPQNARATRARGNAQWPKNAPTTSRRERLAAAETLRATAPALRPLSAKALRSLLRPWLTAGWTVRDLTTALDQRPNGQKWTYETRPRSAAGWLRWRLSHWLNEDGQPLASPSQQNATTRARERHRHQQLAASLEAARRAAVPMPETVRAALKATRCNRPQR